MAGDSSKIDPPSGEARACAATIVEPPPQADRDDRAERLLAGGLPRDPAAERRALAAVEHRLLGRHVVPLQVSRYVLVRRLGGGGGGVVYAAHDPELDRAVAIKLLVPKVGREGDDAERGRIEREAKALARLTHPNVIAVYDVGTFDASALPDLALTSEPGRDGVFIVMELVEGSTLTQWLQQDQRPWRAVVRVLLAAGRGLAAAHAAGLVHRDIKPDNVLVGGRSDDPERVRVVDFGLARFEDPATPYRATQSSELPFLEASSSVTEDTRPGTMMGTPTYMAPEQHRAADVDARTDQYGFCVMAYEALYGCRPFSGATIGELGEKKAAGRVRPPPERGVPRRLYSIIRRGLAPDPDDRHPTMKVLLGRLQAVADRRRRVALAAVSASGVGVLAFGIYAMSNPADDPCDRQQQHLQGIWDDARKQSIAQGIAASGRPYAEASWRTVETIVDKYAQDWIRMRRQVCRAGADTPGLERGLACFDVRLEQLDALARMLESGEPTAIERAVRVAEGLPPLGPCAHPHKQQADDGPEQLELERARAEARRLYLSARYDEAAAAAESAVEIAERHERWADLADALIVLADVAGESGRVDDAERYARRAWVAAERQGDDELVARALTELIQVVGRKQARYEEADRLVELAKAKLEHRRIDDERVAALAYEVGAIRYDQGRYAEAAEANERALRIRERLLEPSDWRIAAGLNALGLVLHARGDTVEAREVLQRSLRIFNERLGPEHPEPANVLANLALVEAAEGHQQEAIARLQHVLEIRRAALGPDHAIVGQTLGMIAERYMALGQFDEATKLHEEALATARRALGDDHPGLGFALTGLANAAAYRGQLDEAERYHRRVLALYESLPVDDYRRGFPHANLGSVYREQGRLSEARLHAERALQLWVRVLPRDHRDIALAREVLGTVLLDQGETERAAALLEDALRTRLEASDARTVARIRVYLAKAIARRDPLRAHELATQARADLSPTDDTVHIDAADELLEMLGREHGLR